MNFLNPEEWRDLEALEKEHEVLTEDLIKQLHERLRPYFLRRIKSEVLQLPPKVRFLLLVAADSVTEHHWLSVRMRSLYLFQWPLCKRKFTVLF